MSRVVWLKPVCYIVLALVFISADNFARSESASTAPSQVQVPPAQAEQVGKGEEFQRQAQQKPRQQPPPRGSPSGAAAQAEQPNGSSKASLAETKAIDRIAAEIRESLQLRKTIVVWLVEQSPEAAPLTRNMPDHICRILEEFSAGATLPQMAVIGYGPESRFLISEPTSDVEKIRKALSELAGHHASRADKVVPFAAVNKAIEKFLPYRKLGYEVLFVIAGTSTGDDLPQADEAIAALKRSAVPVFGLGPAVTFEESALTRSQRSAISIRFDPAWPNSMQNRFFPNASSWNCSIEMKSPP